MFNSTIRDSKGQIVSPYNIFQYRKDQLKLKGYDGQRREQSFEKVEANKRGSGRADRTAESTYQGSRTGRSKSGGNSRNVWIISSTNLQYFKKLGTLCASKTVHICIISLRKSKLKTALVYRSKNSSAVQLEIGGLYV